MTTLLTTGRSLMTVLIAAALLSIGLAGCNTTAGFGQDVKAAGSAIEGKATEDTEY